MFTQTILLSWMIALEILWEIRLERHGIPEIVVEAIEIIRKEMMTEE